MTQKINFNLFPISTASLVARMAVGAFIGLVLITLFLLGPGSDSDPDWGKYWMIRPLIIVPLAGAAGGAFNYFMVHQDYKSSLLKILAYILSFIVFLIGLWLGMVLGLDGTYWN